MVRSDWILPRADAACGKVFIPTARAPKGIASACNSGIRQPAATGQAIILSLSRCRRCGGFHVVRKSSKAPAVEKPSAFAATA